MSEKERDEDLARSGRGIDFGSIVVSDEALQKIVSAHVTGDYVTATDASKVLSALAASVAQLVNSHRAGTLVPVLPAAEFARWIWKLFFIPDKQESLKFKDDEEIVQMDRELFAQTVQHAEKIAKRIIDGAPHETVRELIDATADPGFTERVLKSFDDIAPRIFLDQAGEAGLNRRRVPKSLPSTKNHRLKVEVRSVHPESHNVEVVVVNPIDAGAYFADLRKRVRVGFSNDEQADLFILAQWVRQPMEITVRAALPVARDWAKAELQLISIDDAEKPLKAATRRLGQIPLQFGT